MRSQLATAVLTATLICAGASGAMAYQYTFGGTVTAASNGSNIDTTGLVNQAITIVVSGQEFLNGQGPLDTIGQTETTFGPSFSGATITIGNAAGSTRAIYVSPSFIKNDGSTSSLSFQFGDSFGSFGPIGSSGSLYGADTNFQLNASSGHPDIPLNPEQSFGSIGIQGSGIFSSVPFSDPDQDPPGGFSIAFNLSTLRGSGSVSAVPLPASLPTFAAALLALGALGYGVKRRRPSHPVESA